MALRSELQMCDTGVTLCPVWDHHRRAIQRWVDHAADRPEFLAVVVAGSLTKGYGTEASDVDGFIVVTPEEFARRKGAGEIFWINSELCDYEGGYIDAKCVSLEWIETVDRVGSEPARSAFIGAQVPWSRIGGLEDLCRSIVRYPEAGREDRMRRFVAQIEFSRWFVSEGERRDNPYIVAFAASRLVLFCTRLLLAHNRVLYPYHKWMLRALEESAEKPDGIVPALEAFARAPTASESVRIRDLAINFRVWPALESEWPNQFLKDSEWNWIDHEAPIEDI